MQTLQVLKYIKGYNRLAGPFGTMPQEPWHPGKGAKPDHVIQLIAGNCAPMQVIKQPEHGRTSTTDKQKLIIFSDKLWLIANNSNSLSRSKSIIRNNLGLCKCSEIYLIWNFQKHCHGSCGIKIWIWQGKICQTN